MKKILVTGAGGYIGSVSTYLLLQGGYEVVAIDNFSTGFREPLELLQNKFGVKKLRYYEADLASDLSPIFEKEANLQVVVHYAARCSVNESMDNPSLYFSNNVCATQHFLTTILGYGVQKIVFSSTCAVYGEAETMPITESHPTRPTNPYGESKLMVETLLRWYGELKGLKYVILRYFNVCGATDDGLIGDAKKPSVHLMQNAVRGALGIEKFLLTCPTVATPDSTPIRDYVNVVDLNQAHIRAIEYLITGGRSEIINLGTGNGNSVMEIINAVQQITGVKFAIRKGEARRGEYPRMIASIEKAKKVLNWQPNHRLEDSVNSLVKWYKSRPSGWLK